MRNYEQIIRGIKETPWLITQGGFDTICEIVERHRHGGKMTAEELSARLAGAGRGSEGNPETGQGVGILPLYGPIFPKANLMTEMSGATSLEQWQRDFRSMMNDPRVGTIVMDIDSPGGVAYGISEMAQEIYESRDIKPVVAVANPMSASAALFLGSQANEFYVTPSGQVGSIGVIAAHESIKGMNEKLGIKTTFITAGKYKAEMAAENELSADAIEYHQKIVDEIYQDFVGAVARGRNTTADDVIKNYGEGRMLTAKMALDVGLVDGAKTLDDVLGELLSSGGKLSSTTARASARLSSLTPRASYDREKEHSEPGTGIGGEPQEDPTYHPNEDEDDWQQGGRFNNPEQEASLMNREQLLAYASRLGIENADKLEDDALATAVSAKLDDALDQNDEIQAAVASAEHTRNFATDYPEEFAEMQRIKAERRENSAKLFAGNFARMGEKGAHGLSIPVREEVEKAHLALTGGTFDEEMLANLISSVAQKNAVIEFGEKGSSRITDEDGVATPTGDRRTDRKMFADKVKEIMEQDSLDRKAALAVASERYPELAQAYVGQ